MSVDIDPDAADDAGDAIAEADEETTDRERWFARAYIVGLVVTLIVGTGLLVQLGFISGDVTLSADANVGWIIELAVAAIAAVIVLFTVGMGIKATGGGLVNAIISGIARMLDGYSLPDNDDE